jgi:hypothetical protein
MDLLDSIIKRLIVLDSRKLRRGDRTLGPELSKDLSELLSEIYTPVIVLTPRELFLIAELEASEITEAFNRCDTVGEAIVLIGKGLKNEP